MLVGDHAPDRHAASVTYENLLAGLGCETDEAAAKLWGITPPETEEINRV